LIGQCQNYTFLSPPTTLPSDHCKSHNIYLTNGPSFDLSSPLVAFLLAKSLPLTKIAESIDRNAGPSTHRVPDNATYAVAMLRYRKPGKASKQRKTLSVQRSRMAGSASSFMDFACHHHWYITGELCRQCWTCVAERKIRQCFGSHWYV
jgi:hypothetical protein